MTAPVASAGGPQRRSRLAGAGLLAILGALLALQVAWIARHGEQLRPLRPGELAPGFRLPRADGRGEMALGSLRGQVVLVDFWATWCGPCRETMPAIDRLYRKHHDAGFEVFSVNVDATADARQAALGFAARHRLPFPVVIDDGRASALYKVESIPLMVLLDRQGRIREIYGSAFSISRLERDLDGKITRLLSER